MGKRIFFHIMNTLIQIYPAYTVHFFRLQAEFFFFHILPQHKDPCVLSVMVFFPEEHVIPDNRPVTAADQFFRLCADSQFFF